MPGGEGWEGGFLLGGMGGGDMVWCGGWGEGTWFALFLWILLPSFRGFSTCLKICYSGAARRFCSRLNHIRPNLRVIFKNWSNTYKEKVFYFTVPLPDPLVRPYNWFCLILNHWARLYNWFCLILNHLAQLYNWFCLILNHLARLYNWFLIKKKWNTSLIAKRKTNWENANRYVNKKFIAKKVLWI